MMASDKVRDMTQREIYQPFWEWSDGGSHLRAVFSRSPSSRSIADGRTDPREHQSGSARSLCPVLWLAEHRSILHRAATVAMIDTSRILLADAAGVSDAKLEELKKGWLEDIGRPGANMVKFLAGQQINRVLNIVNRCSPYSTTGLGRSDYREEKHLTSFVTELRCDLYLSVFQNRSYGTHPDHPRVRDPSLLSWYMHLIHCLITRSLEALAEWVLEKTGLVLTFLCVSKSSEKRESQVHECI